MPRGFLVKRRSRRPAGAFRVRPPGGPPAPRLEEAPRAPQPSEERPPEDLLLPQPLSPLAAGWGVGPADNAAPAPAESELRALTPASAESFPLGVGPAPEEKLPPPPPPPRTPLPLALPGPPLALKRPPPRARALPTAAKKPKAARRLSFADEVTTSPVLGLRIKAAAAGGGEGPRGGARPALLLGEFVCQLCKEPYADPLALAQHRCSRIVRVEYRCPECHKSFSCPANLASHRRWHKPRPPAGPGQDKENSRDQHHGAPDSARPRPPSPAAQLCPEGPGAPPGELFLCPYCRKGFRRQAYLRKHLGTHQPPAPAAAYGPGPGPPPAPPLGFPCHLCGAPFPSADVRDKHQLWHAARDELLLPLGAPEGSAAPAGGEKPIFACKYCAAAFFSAPGLARHVSKCHPAESRQVLLLQMPLRPGC
ncbi:hypothetical protein lerEdw1_004873 [Lerista edwardsae]|nr:hypothetical protein lerEdw1_004873 [Lerista edwardsae]